MYCRNCGKSINDKASYCPYCQTRVDIKMEEIIEKQNEMELKIEEVLVSQNNELKTNQSILVCAILSLVTVFIAFHEIIMIAGIVLGLISLIFALLTIKNKERLKYSTLIIAFSIAGILSNICWLIFTLWVL